MTSSASTRPGDLAASAAATAPDGIALPGAGDTNADSPRARASLPTVSVIVCAYNEAAILERSLTELTAHLRTLEGEFDWEIVLVDDGSKDDTGEIARRIAISEPRLRVFHHPSNFGLGQALRFGFKLARGDYLVTLDADLSYDPSHVERLVREMRATGARVVIASPYMVGGELTSVPFGRRHLSKNANRFLAAVSASRLSTLTGMVRAYDARFVRGLNLKSLKADINPEIVHKALLLGARIEEIPAHLDWSRLQRRGAERQSSLAIGRHTLSIIAWGFLFRPFLFFFLPGLLLLAFSGYVTTWVLIHFTRFFNQLDEYDWVIDRASAAVAAAFQQFPHTFIVAGISAMVGIQLISLGILSVQSKAYFEEIFHLGTTLLRRQVEDDSTEP